MDERPVVIVGAGPVGMLLACELLQQDVQVRLVDSAREHSAHSRATIVWPRLLELTRRTGLSERLVDNGHRIDGVAYFSRGRRLGTAWMDRLHDTPYPFAVAIAQSETEKIIESRLAELGGTIERGVRLVAVHDADGPRPVAVLEGHGGRVQEVETSWLVGADGAHSSLRRLIGASFEGEEFDVSFAVTDAEVNGDAPTNVVSYCYTEQGSLALGPLGRAVTRVAVSVPHTEDDAPPSREFFQAIVDERGPGHNVLGELRFSTTFRVHARIASSFRFGHCLLAGDAAHVMSPAGAQGMNTGLQDAVNLGWRLGGVLRGRLSDVVVDGYDRDRRAAAHTVARTTAMQTRWGLLRTAPRIAVRDAVLGAASASGLLQRSIAPLVAQTGVSYPVAGASRHNRAALGGGRRARPGDRLPVLLPGPGPRSRGAVVLADRSWTTVASDRISVVLWPGRRPRRGWERTARAARAVAAPYASLVEAPGVAGPLADALGPGPALAVVRPDGHLHARVAPGDVADLPAILAAAGSARQRSAPPAVHAT